MSDYSNAPRPTNTQPPREGSKSGMAFIIGGLVVAVVVLFWLFSAADTDTADGDLNVNVEGGEAAQQIENTAEDAANAVEGAANDAAEAARDAANAAENAAEDAANAVEDAAQDAEQAVDDATNN